MGCYSLSAVHDSIYSVHFCIHMMTCLVGLCSCVVCLFVPFLNCLPTVYLFVALTVLNRPLLICYHLVSICCFADCLFVVCIVCMCVCAWVCVMGFSIYKLLIYTCIYIYLYIYIYIYIYIIQVEWKTNKVLKFILFEKQTRLYIYIYIYIII